MSCVCFPPTFCCSYSFCSYFCRPDECGLSTWPNFTPFFPFPLSPNTLRCTSSPVISVLFFSWLSLFNALFRFICKYFFLLSSIYYCPLTFLCVSLYSSEEQNRMGTEETVHIKINRRRRRSQMWHQWYDGCALSIVKICIIRLFCFFCFCLF